jgi:hypothetical protein
MNRKVEQQPCFEKKPISTVRPSHRQFHAFRLTNSSLDSTWKTVFSNNHTNRRQQQETELSGPRSSIPILRNILVSWIVCRCDYER